jgi:hypothetical protein
MPSALFGQEEFGDPVLTVTAELQFGHSPLP